MRLDLAHDVPVDLRGTVGEPSLRAVDGDGMPREGPAQAPRLVVDDVSLGHGHAS